MFKCCSLCTWLTTRIWRLMEDHKYLKTHGGLQELEDTQRTTWIWITLRTKRTWTYGRPQGHEDTRRTRVNWRHAEDYKNLNTRRITRTWRYAEDHKYLKTHGGGTAKNRKIHVGRVGSLSNHGNVVFDQESLNQLRGMSWCVVMLQLPRITDTLRMDKSSVEMECTEPVLIPTFSVSSLPVTRWSCMTRVRTWSMSLSFRLVEVLPERGSLSTEMRPYLNRFYHSLICVMPMASSPKPRWIFHLAIAKLLAKFDAMPLLESFHHFRRK